MQPFSSVGMHGATLEWGGCAGAMPSMGGADASATFSIPWTVRWLCRGEHDALGELAGQGVVLGRRGDLAALTFQHVLGAFCGPTPVAFLTCYVFGGRARLGALCVDAALEPRHLGGALLRRLADDLTKLGIRDLVADAWANGLSPAVRAI